MILIEMYFPSDTFNSKKEEDKKIREKDDFAKFQPLVLLLKLGFMSLLDKPLKLRMQKIHTNIQNLWFIRVSYYLLFYLN